MAKKHLVVVGILAAALGCGTEKSEATAVARAVERYRLADNAEKPGAAEALAKVGCTDGTVCAVRDTCAAASGATVRGLVLKGEVEQGLREVQAKRRSPDDPLAKALPDKLDEASRLLEEGHTKMAFCEEGLATLKLKYRF